ncbi:hypothetical protein GQX74_002877 [Glossina fuscipes]|nr:hypothetical protein GQX74_002877 [Glossina fuscipes]
MLRENLVYPLKSMTTLLFSNEERMDRFLKGQIDKFRFSTEEVLSMGVYVQVSVNSCNRSSSNSCSSNSGGKFSSEHNLRTICSQIRVLQSTSNSGTPKLTSICFWRALSVRPHHISHNLYPVHRYLKMLYSRNGILDPDVLLVLEQLYVWTIYFDSDRSLQRGRLHNPGDRLPIIKNAVRVESNKNPTRLPVFGDCSATDGGVKEETSLTLCFVVLSLRSSTSEERSGSSDDGIPVFGGEHVDDNVTQIGNG